MKLILTFIMAFLLVGTSFSQNFRFDLNVRANALVPIDPSNEKYDRDWVGVPIAASVEALFFPIGFVGIGGFYTQSVMPGQFEYYRGGDYYDENYDKNDYQYSMYGATLQLTTNRKKGFRIYAVARAGKYEIVEEFKEFTVANSGFGYSGGFGIMVKLSRAVSFNIFEANYSVLPKEFSLDESEAMSAVYVQSGLSIKLIQKK